MAVGLTFQIIFHVGTKEISFPANDQKNNEMIANKTMNWRGFMKCARFYIVCKILSLIKVFCIHFEFMCEGRPDLHVN